MNSVLVEIDTLDPSMIEPTSVIFAVGKRGQGKSFLCKDILYRLRKKVDYCIGMSLTERQNGHMSSFLAPAFVYGNIEAEVFRLMKSWHTMCTLNGTTLRGALYLDDCMAQKALFRKKPLNQYIAEICKNGRHWPLLLLNAMQSFKDMAPELRSQADWIFMFASQNEEELEDVRSEYLSSTLSKDQFKALMQKLTQDRGILVIRNDPNNANDLRKMVYRYKATPTPDRKYYIGNPALYLLSQYYRPQRPPVAPPLKASELRDDVRSPSAPTALPKKADIIVQVNSTAKT